MIKINKILKERLEELKGAINLLNDALDNIKIGRKEYYEILSGQLRSLICTGNQTPLLLDIANELKIPLICYSGRSLDDEKALGLPIPVLSLPMHLVDIVPFEPTGHIEYEFSTWLKTPFLVVDSVSFSAQDIIKKHANKRGGSHYDKLIPLDMSKIENIRYFKTAEYHQNEIEKYLIKISMLVIYFGKMILDKQQL